MIGRRLFIGAAGTAIIAPAALAQPVGSYRMAVLDATFPAEELRQGGHPRYDALFTELRRLGYIEDSNLTVKRWSGRGLPETSWTGLAQEALDWQPDIVFAAPSRMASRVKALTATIPIVFVGADPVGFGLAPTLARPGANLTGMAADAGSEGYHKQMQLLLDVVPEARRFGILMRPDSWDGPFGDNYRDGAARLGIEVIPIMVEGTVDEASLGRAFQTLASDPVPALVVGVFTEFLATAPIIARLALEAALPAMSYANQFAEAGLLMSYGPDTPDQFRRAGGYVDQILRGADPAEMAIQQPTKFLFVINLQTAAALGLIAPPQLVLFATDLIE